MTPVSNAFPDAPSRIASGDVPPAPAGGVSALGVAASVLRHWRSTLAIVAVCMVAAAVVQLLRPARYEARTLLILPPRASDARGLLMGSTPQQGGGGASALLGLGGQDPNVKLISVVMGSRSLADSLRQRFGPLPDRDRRVTNNPDGSISVAVTHSDPRRAAEIANSFGPLVNSLVVQVGVDAAVRRESLLEGQIRLARQELEEAEGALVRFQRGRNVPAPEAQARGTVDAALQLQERIAEKEVEVAQLRRTATAANPQLRAAESELSNWRAQLRRLGSGRSGGQVLVPLSESAELGVSTTRLMRQLARAEQIYTSLTAAMAQARMERGNTLPVVTVVDAAIPPEEPKGPGVPLVLALAAVVGAVIAVLVAVIRDGLGRPRRVAGADDLAAAWQGLGADVAPRGRQATHR